MRFIYSLSSHVERLGILGLSGMALVTLVDVILSKSVSRPLPGSTEMVGVLQVFAISAGLAFSKIDGRHIRIEFFLSMLPEAARRIIDILGSLLGLGFFVLAFLSTFEYALGLLKTRTVTLLIKIPLAPFLFWASLCSLLMCCVLLFEILQFARNKRSPWIP